ncbi:aldehyde oxidoreductase molybdenum-binding subunit PaoC [Novosphingobium sp. AP12]|uniref:aldehyde oxidoreductase molybdenum-binding subunit PaoC n=1 Tax=Novosphingobium sp. AP12 TaxID=1144305 RepID=UPI000271E70D|nr:aldehyde oxidoreductase molybdenum-binding subunit PaoC [Novosphingobium sp. AP12]EJL33414.1 aerobic-type carbon monoxide dehydrogenase, large subunit CoxL/CutL-like protein [Novosphingobium sp. AP12]
MEFSAPSPDNAIDQLKIVGKPTTRIDGPLKTTGSAPYAYERHDVAADQAYGFIVGAAIAKGTIKAIDLREARAAAGVIGTVSTLDYSPLALGPMNTANLFGGAKVEHYHQAIAVVVAETFEQARAAAALVRVDYARSEGEYSLDRAAHTAVSVPPEEGERRAVGDFPSAFAQAAVTIDREYTTPGHSHAMMEPHATIAAWEKGRLTVWTSNQMIGWGKRDLCKAFGLKPNQVRIDSPYIGGGFGGKLFVRSDVMVAALAARVVGRPVKLALHRPLIINNTTHRAATRQRIRIGAERSGKIVAIAHDSISGNLPNGKPERSVQQTTLFYGSANVAVDLRMAQVDLPEANAMRAPGEAPGLMALEIAMDEMAEKLGLDPVVFRIMNDTQVDPTKPDRHFSERNFVECLRTGAERFGWSDRPAKPASRREGRWLIGMGMAGGFRNNQLQPSAARVRLRRDGKIIVETDMTDIGTGSYTIIAQTAAETMGVKLTDVVVVLGDSDFPVSAGSGGQFGAVNSTSGVYAACIKLQSLILERLGFDSADATFVNGKIQVGSRSVTLKEAVQSGELLAEDGIVYAKGYEERAQQSTFAGHFVEVAVDSFTGETHIRRMLAVCDAGRILNPITARSQVIGAMTMGAGAALMEELVVDTRFGFFVNHDLAGYEVPVHADIPHQEVIFLNKVDPWSTPMKAKGVGELGICGVAAAVANAVYNATGVRIRDYPITLDKYLANLPRPD